MKALVQGVKIFAWEGGEGTYYQPYTYKIAKNLLINFVYCCNVAPVGIVAHLQLNHMEIGGTNQGPKQFL